MSDPGLRDGAPFDPARPPSAELGLGVTDGFTICFVGDCILSRPVSSYAARDPGFAAVLELLGSADVVVGNLETALLDVRRTSAHPHAWDGDWALVGSPDVAADLVRMNVRLVGRANNHALDWGIEGLLATDEALDSAGVVHAGTGAHASPARAARHLETARGRVGLASFATTYAPFSDAVDPIGESPGRPGLSGLRLDRTLVLPSDLASSVREAVAAVGAGADVDRVLGLDVAAGTTRAHNRYEPDPAQLRDILRGIRLGAQHADHLTAALHAHEAEDESHLAPAADVVRRLAHAAIDSGADAFMTTGIHHLGGVEVRHGAPVLLGLGNFFWSDLQTPVPRDLWDRYRPLLEDSFDRPADATDADLGALLNALDYAHPEVFESVVARCRYERGRLDSFDLFPVELGRGSTLTTSGLPRLVSGEHGAAIIDRVARLSTAYETRIEWTGECGRVVLGPRPLP